jgi:hypothetical protein
VIDPNRDDGGTSCAAVSTIRIGWPLSGSRPVREFVASHRRAFVIASFLRRDMVAAHVVKGDRARLLILSLGPVRGKA